MAFYDGIAPHAERAIAHLDECDVDAMSPADKRLMNMLFSMILVSYAVNIFERTHPRFGCGILRDGCRTGAVNTRPLEGLRVVDAATLAAGPLVATALGEFGADVIKVEQPGAGDPLRTWGARRGDIGLVWKSVSRNKKCVTADLRTPAGRSLLHGLLETSDVLVINTRPST